MESKMITINEKLPDGHVFAVDTEFNGMVSGSATIPSGRRVEINGMITGDVAIGPGASVEIRGTVVGTVRNDGGYVHISGIVGKIVDAGPIETTIGDGAIVRG